LKGKGERQSKREIKMMAKTGKVDRERMKDRLSERARCMRRKVAKNERER
jgi:hypothetical protein